MAVWFVLSDKVILASMSKKQNITLVADTFFHLWQRQVSLLAQSPDKAFENLILNGQKIVGTLNQKEFAVEDETDTTKSL